MQKKAFEIISKYYCWTSPSIIRTTTGFMGGGHMNTSNNFWSCTPLVFLSTNRDCIQRSDTHCKYGGSKYYLMYYICYRLNVSNKHWNQLHFPEHTMAYKHRPPWNTQHNISTVFRVLIAYTCFQLHSHPIWVDFGHLPSFKVSFNVLIPELYKPLHFVTRYSGLILFCCLFIIFAFAPTVLFVDHFLALRLLACLVYKFASCVGFVCKCF